MSGRIQNHHTLPRPTLSRRHTRRLRLRRIAQEEACKRPPQACPDPSGRRTEGPATGGVSRRAGMPSTYVRSGRQFAERRCVGQVMHLPSLSPPHADDAHVG